MAQVQSGIDALTGGPGATNDEVARAAILGELRTNLTQFGKDVLAHLDNEEMYYATPVARKASTTKFRRVPHLPTCTPGCTLGPMYLLSPLQRESTVPRRIMKSRSHPTVQFRFSTARRKVGLKQCSEAKENRSDRGCDGSGSTRSRSPSGSMAFQE